MCTIFTAFPSKSDNTITDIKNCKKKKKNVLIHSSPTLLIPVISYKQMDLGSRFSSLLSLFSLKALNLTISVHITHVINTSIV